MPRYDDLKTFYVDFHDLPWFYGALKIYAENKADAKVEARALWARMCCKEECKRLPNYTTIYDYDPAAPMFENMIKESRKSGIPVTDMY